MGSKVIICPQLANTNPYLGRNSKIREMLEIVEKDHYECCIRILYFVNHLGISHSFKLGSEFKNNPCRMA